jgi:hypothetical protein
MSIGWSVRKIKCSRLIIIVKTLRVQKASRPYRGYVRLKRKILPLYSFRPRNGFRSKTQKTSTVCTGGVQLATIVIGRCGSRLIYGIEIYISYCNYYVFKFFRYKFIKKISNYIKYIYEHIDSWYYRIYPLAAPGV